MKGGLPALPIPVYILAGGDSTRFGGDKARAVVGGEPLLVRVAAQLDPIAASVTVVADRADKYADLGLATIGDAVPGLGPLGGVATSLAHLAPDADWLLAAACDLVAARPAWVMALVEASSTPAPATAFRSSRGWEPLFALYHRSLAATAAEMAAGVQRGVHGLLDRCGAVGVDLPDDWPSVAQINTPEDYRRVIDQG